MHAPKCLLAVVSLAGAAAAAPKAHPIKAEMLCGTFVDGKIKEVVTSGKRAKITDPIACAIHVNDANEPAHMGNVHTVRHPSDGKKVTTTGKTDDLGGGKDYEVVLTTAADDNGEIAFKSCEDFDVVGTISDDLGVYFTKTIKIQQSCPKPKPVAATIACEYTLKSGKSVAIAPKTKERPASDLDAINCTVSTKDGRLGSGQLYVKGVARWEQYNDDGTHAPTSQDGVGGQVAAEGSTFSTGKTFEVARFPPCGDVDLQIDLADADDHVLASKKFHTQVTCGE